MTEQSTTRIATVSELLEDGYALQDVDSTDEHLLLDLSKGSTVRTVRLSRPEVRRLVNTDLLDELAANATEPERDGVEPVGPILA